MTFARAATPALHALALCHQLHALALCHQWCNQRYQLSFLSTLPCSVKRWRQLAVKMARLILIIKMTQPNTEVRDQLHDVYGSDAMMLIAVGQTVTAEFATVASVNNS
ncbi:hypothetical protein IQ266_12440 [filamentous cyanobacterium LEGE 11480]|uniref:Uncharacterized protein n=1 Tax=Romeriopsis navalis LEGE 11480 TaxID=2777977 RepID=A0A928VLI9_9CYAN|nr:hexameric tyrosine-coordinated heme protein [Romeriopsis navalis]MBE9030540.1 hypothetical protein [Romeriopsis navalis LEGE 11480]